MRDLPGPGIEPVSPALAGGFLTPEPPGKPCGSVFHSVVVVSSFSLHVGPSVLPQAQHPASLPPGPQKSYLAETWNPALVCSLGLWERRNISIVVLPYAWGLVGLLKHAISFNFHSIPVRLVLYLFYRWRNLGSESHLLWVWEVLLQKLGKQVSDVSLIARTPRMRSTGNYTWAWSS